MITKILKVFVILKVNFMQNYNYQLKHNALKKMQKTLIMSLEKIVGIFFTYCIYLLLFFIFAPNVFSQSYPLWGELKPGDYQVGFTSIWEFDYSRRYPVASGNDSSDKAKKMIPRPILINIWYPAERQKSIEFMPYKAYFDIDTDSEKIRDFAKNYRDYNLSVLAKETLSKSRDKFDKEEEALFTELLNTKTASIKNGLAVSEKFPVVIYHQGHGASFEDNSVLCEYLASNGFIVIGSSFLKESGETLGVDSRNGSIRELIFLLNHISKLPNADVFNVALAGHSGGAQAAILAKSKGYLAIDSIVSLDTTQENYNNTNPLWLDFVPKVLENSKSTKGSIIAFTNHTAVFQLYDALEEMDRIYVTFPNKALSHNEYIWQGVLAKRLNHKLKLKRNSKSNEETFRELELVEKYYKEIANYTLDFLNIELKKDERSKKSMEGKISEKTVYKDASVVSRIIKGQNQSEPYELKSAYSPKPRQMRRLIDEKGICHTISILNKFKKEVDFNPIYDPIFASTLITDFLDKKRDGIAIELFRYYESIGINVKKIYLILGRYYAKVGLNDLALKPIKRLLLLDPNNTEAKTLLNKLEKKK